MQHTLRILICLAFAAPCTLALAHDTWLASEARTVQARAEIRLDMTSAEHFPVAGTSIARDRIGLADCQQGTTHFTLEAGFRGAKTLRLAAPAPAAGAVACRVQLKPRALDLDTSKVAEYLDEIDAPAAVREAWKTSPEPRRWNETYTKNALVTIPAAAPGTALGQPPSPPLALELRPQADLSDGKSGTTLPVLALRDGKPMAGLSVALVHESGGPPQRLRTDAQGQALFHIGKPGRWMLSATDLWPLNAAEGRWESQFSTHVFEVLAVGK